MFIFTLENSARGVAVSARICERKRDRFSVASPLDTIRGDWGGLARHEERSTQLITSFTLI